MDKYGIPSVITVPNGDVKSRFQFDKGKDYIGFNEQGFLHFAMTYMTS